MFLFVPENDTWTKIFKKAAEQHEGYYTLEVEISPFNETDENRIVVISGYLLYVRLVKTIIEE